MSLVFINPYRFASAASFDPTSISGIQWWYDASDTSSITHSSGAVSQWNDKSGNGRHLTASSHKPTTGTRTIAGKNVLDFDGTDDYMETSAHTDQSLQTNFVVFEPDSLAETIIFEKSANTNSNNGFFIALGPASGQVQSQVHASTTNGVDANAYKWNSIAAVGTPVLVTMYYNGTANTNFYKNGVDQGFGTTTAAGFDDAIGSKTLASNPLYVGARSGSVVPFNGKLAELIHYTRVLTGTERSDVENYLISKWGL